MEIILKIITTVIILILAALIMALPVMYLWNWLIPKIFNLVPIDFWEALGLCLLCGALFKNSGSNKK